MNHEKIVILPCDQPQLANQILSDLVFNQAFVLFIVLGSNAMAIRLVELGANIAGTRSDPGLVVWITDRDVSLDTLILLKENNSIRLQRWEDISAFTLSIMDRVADVIHSDDAPAPDIARVFQSFQIGILG